MHLAVSKHPALRSPDFPRHALTACRDRPTNLNAPIIIASANSLLAGIAAHQARRWVRFHVEGVNLKNEH